MKRRMGIFKPSKILKINSLHWEGVSVSRLKCEILDNVTCFLTKDARMTREIVVISLFDGISCGLQALKNLGFINIKYFASEIEPNAIKISEKNHPEIIRLGDVRTVKISGNYIESENGKWFLGDENYHQRIDLILAGSP